MRILFIAQARMGDVCCAIPAYNVLRRENPDAHIAWQVCGKYIHLIPKSISEIIETPMPTGPNRPARLDFDKVIKAQPMFRHKEWEKSKKHIIDLIADWSGVKLRPKDRKIHIEVPTEVSDKISSTYPITNTPFVTICCSPCYSCKNWDYKIRKKLVTRLRRKGYKVIAIGGKDGKNLDANKSLYGKLSVIETVAVIQKSSGYIGPDNGVSWLATSAGHIPKVMVTDKSRLRQGVTGFERYLRNNKIVDIFYEQANPNTIIKSMEKLRGR